MIKKAKCEGSSENNLYGIGNSIRSFKEKMALIEYKKNIGDNISEKQI